MAAPRLGPSGPTRVGLALSITVVVACIGVIIYQAVHYDAGAKDGPERLSPNGIDGTVIVCGDGPVADDVRRRFVAAAGGEKANIVVLTEADDQAGRDAQRGVW